MKNIASYFLTFIIVFTVSCKKDDSDSETFDWEPSSFEPDQEDLDANGLPRMLFSAELPSISQGLEYTIELDRWDIPNNNTDAITTTANLQAAIDWAHNEGYTQVKLPEGEYLVGEDVNDNYQGGIDIRDNTEFIFEEGAVLTIDTNNKWNYCVLRLNGDNIIVRDGIIIGDKDSHIFTPRESDGKTAHDEGHGICVWSNNNVLVDNMEIRDLTGDGSLVLGSNDVTFTNNNISNNRRQGISIVGGTSIEIKDNEIHHIKGTAPEFGIDIEGPGRIDEDILIQSNYFHHNTGGDIVNATGENVYILDNILEQGEGSEYIDGPLVSWHGTHNIIARNTLTMLSNSVNLRAGYIQYSSGGEKGHNRATYVHENVMNECGMYMYKSSQADVRRNQFLGYFCSFENFENAVLIDNNVTYSEIFGGRFCWSYRFNNATGFASGNTIEDEPEEIPLSEEEPHTLQCVLDGW